MNAGIEGNSYGAVISPTRITYKVGQGSTQVLRDAILIGTNDDEVNYGSTQSATDLILQLPMLSNNGAYVGSGALLLQVPDGTAKGGNVRGSGAVDLQSLRNISSQVASGSQSVAIGANNISSGITTVAIGDTNSSIGTISTAIGYSNSATSMYSTALGYGNHSTGNSTVAIGGLNYASGLFAASIGYSNNASGAYSAAIGYSNTTNGTFAAAIGSYSLSNGSYSVTVGPYGGTNYISSKVAIGTGYSTTAGAYQIGILGLGATTTDATATILKSDTSAISANNQCVLQNNNAASFTIEVVAQNTSTGMAGRWEAKGLIKRGANASATALVGTPTVALTNGDNESWITASAVAVSADTTNGALAVTVTGSASATIHWMCRINTVEVM